MCNGRWLMRDRLLLTLDETSCARRRSEQATRIDAFLSSREVSVLQKLVAIGGAVEQESFEVQVKARVPSEAQVRSVTDGERGDDRPSEPLSPVRHLLSFDDPDQGRLRYREDDSSTTAGNSPARAPG